MSIEEEVGARVRVLREARAMSLAAVGKELGRHLDKPWPRQAVSAAEKGRRVFTARELLAFSAIFGCSVDSLLGLFPVNVAVGLDQVRAQVARDEIARFRDYLSRRESDLATMPA